VRDDQFDRVYAAYLEDEEVLSFLEDNNPAALKEMTDRLREAIDRGLWRARSNSAYARLSELAGESPEELALAQSALEKTA
jgi:cobaltochelatase CobN